METTQNPINKISEIELVYKPIIKASDRLKIKSSKEAYEIVLANWDNSKIEFIEQFKILLLNRTNRVMGICEISTGGTSGTIVDVKLVFVAAIKANAHAIILAHNHPSGELRASNADIAITKKVKEAGTFLDILVLDHLIISSESYYSFADEGKL